MRRHRPLLLATLLFLTSCSSELGRQIPGCDPNQMNSATLMLAQSVAGAEYSPCLNDLKVGWTYEHLVAERGQSRFWLSSDRVGYRFLEVTLESSCDLSGATQVPSDEAGAPLLVDVQQADFLLPVTIVPEGSGSANRAYALALADGLTDEVVRGRPLQVRVDASDAPTQDRIDRALEDGRPVFAVGTREQEEGTVELYLPRGNRESPVSLETALDLIYDSLGDPRYIATWYYPFENGCITYKFNAEGEGIISIPNEVQEAIGLWPLEPAREWAEQQGYVLP